MKITIIYTIVSVILGITDIIKMRKQEEYLNSVAFGDLEYYDPIQVTGIHNIIFLPSYIILMVYVLIVKAINTIFYR